jgi:hypothetical protein
MGDYPKMMYRGSFGSQAELEAAWNGQLGIEQKTVSSQQDEEAASKAGFVALPADMVKLAIPTLGAPKKASSRDEPLNVNS